MVKLQLLNLETGQLEAAFPQGFWTFVAQVGVGGDGLCVLCVPVLGALCHFGREMGCVCWGVGAELRAVCSGVCMCACGSLCGCVQPPALL
jgi:hypothetical protein